MTDGLNLRAKLSGPTWSPKTVFVANVPYLVKPERVRAILSEAGPIARFHMVPARQKDRHTGYGFCEFATPEAAETARQTLNGRMIGENLLQIKPAMPPRIPVPEPERLAKKIREATEKLVQQVAEAKEQKLSLPELLERLRALTPEELADATPAVRAQLVALIELLKLE